LKPLNLDPPTPPECDDIVASIGLTPKITITESRRRVAAREEKPKSLSAYIEYDSEQTAPLGISLVPPTRWRKTA